MNARMPVLSAYLGHVSPAGTYWYLAFFTSRLIGQRGASDHTVAAYRDTWRLLLGFASRETGKNPGQPIWLGAGAVQGRWGYCPEAAHAGRDSCPAR